MSNKILQKDKLNSKKSRHFEVKEECFILIEKGHVLLLETKNFLMPIQVQIFFSNKLDMEKKIFNSDI